MAGRFGGDTGDFRIDHALAELADQGYGSNWSVAGKRKSLIKFGRNTGLSLNTRSTVWDVGPANETYLTVAQGNLITVISSSSNSDIGKVISVEGHRYVDGNLIFTIQRVTCNGQTRVPLPIPLCRNSRMEDLSLTATVGDIYAYQGAGTTDTAGVPDNLAFAHNVIRGTENHKQSFKGATTLSSTDALIITAMTAAVAKKQVASVDFGIESAKLTATGPGDEKGFTPKFGEFTLESAGQSALRLNMDPCIVIPPNHEVRAIGTSSAAATQGNFGFSGYLASRSL